MDKQMLKSKSELFNKINKIVELNKTNMKMQKDINEKFMKKGIDNSTVFSLFKGDIVIEQLDVVRLICLVEGIRDNLSIDYLHQNSTYIDISEYFTDNEILAYKMYQPKKEDFITTINLNNVTRISKYEYTCYRNLEWLSKLRKSGLPQYFGDIQRPLEITKNSKGEITKKMSINKKNLHKLKNRFMNMDENGNMFADESKDLISTDIYFFSLLEEGKEPLFVWTGQDENGSIGNLDITPDFDYMSDNYSPFIIADGFHRLTAACDAFDELQSRGEYLDKGFTVHFVLATVERAKQFISDTFERTDIKPEIKEAISGSPKNDALDVLINKCNVLKNNVAKTYNDYKILNTITYRSILLKALDNTIIDYTKVYKTDTRMTKIGRIINNIFEYYKENDILNGVLYSSGMFVGYIAIANTMLEKEDKVNLALVSNMCDKLISLCEAGVFADYNLDKKTVKVKELYKFLESFTMEVLKDEN